MTNFVNVTQDTILAAAQAALPQPTRTIGLRDFSSARPDVVFTADGDEFRAPGNLPVMTLIEFSERSQEATVANRQLLPELFRLILYPDSADLLIGRMRDKDRPIGLEQAMDIIPWLLEQYGLRPTEESSDSSAGSRDPGSGNGSTASGSGGASTSVGSS